MRGRGGGGQGHVGGKKLCAGVHAELFWSAIYCTNPRPDSKSQSGYWSCRGLGRIYLWIMWRYNLATVIAICPLNQPCMCEMGSSIFSTMSQLKVVSTTISSFPSVPSIESKKWYFFLLLVALLSMLILILLIPTSHDLIHRLLLVVLHSGTERAVIYILC